MLLQEAEVLTVPNDTYQRPTPPTVFWFNIGPNILKAATTVCGTY